MSFIARAVRLALALPAAAGAQARSTTVFSPPRDGALNVRAAVVLQDYTVKPLPLLRIVAQRADRSGSVEGTTDLDGRLSMSLPAGAYAIRARIAQPIGGRVFNWAIPVTIKPSNTESIQLTNANASPDSIPVSASAPSTVTNHQMVAAETAVIELARAPESAPVRMAVRESTSAVIPPASTAAPMQPTTAGMSAGGSDGRQARANTSRFFLGLSLNGSAITLDDVSSETESGGGASLQIGWGFTEHFALLLDMSGADIQTDAGSFGLGHFDVAARWHFTSPTRALVPFLEVAYGGRAAVEDNAIIYDDFGDAYVGELSIAGSSYSFGGGLNYHVAPAWALGASLKWTKGEFSRVQLDNVSIDGLELDATSARFNLGFTWYPMTRNRP